MLKMLRVSATLSPHFSKTTDCICPTAVARRVAVKSVRPGADERRTLQVFTRGSTDRHCHRSIFQGFGRTSPSLQSVGGSAVPFFSGPDPHGGRRMPCRKASRLVLAPRGEGRCIPCDEKCSPDRHVVFRGAMVGDRRCAYFAAQAGKHAIGRRGWRYLADPIERMVGSCSPHHSQISRGRGGQFSKQMRMRWSGVCAALSEPAKWPRLWPVTTPRPAAARRAKWRGPMAPAFLPERGRPHRRPSVLW